MHRKQYLRVLRHDDEKDVRRMLEMYLSQDQVSKCMNLSEKERAVFADAYIQTILPQGLSLGLFDDVTGEMVGCALCSDRDNYVKPDDYKQLDECPQLQKMARFDEAMDRKCEDMFPNEKCALYEIVVVDPEMGRRGMAYQLTDRFVELAKRKGYAAILGVSLAGFVRSGFEKRGWYYDYSKQIKFDDYRDPVTGEKIFKDLPPNYTEAVPTFLRLSVPSKL